MEWYKKPSVILASGIGGAALLLASLLGIAKIFPAIGAAIGLVFAVSVTGLATSAHVAEWVAPAATVGVATAGLAAAYFVVVRVSAEAKKAPYDWAMPILAIFAGFLTDLCNDFYLDDEKITRALFSALTAIMMLVGGFLVSKQGLTQKAIGILLPLLVPVTILAKLLLSAQHDTKTLGIQLGHLLKLPLSGAMGLVGLLMLTAFIMITVGFLIARSDAAEGSNTAGG
jgi:hypothetical protein